MVPSQMLVDDHNIISDCNLLCHPPEQIPSIAADSAVGQNHAVLPLPENPPHAHHTENGDA